MKSKLVLIFLFLFFHSLSGENKPDLKNLGNLFPKNFHAVQTGISTVQVSSFIPYQEELSQEWANGNWVDNEKTVTTVDTTNWIMVSIVSLYSAQDGWKNNSKLEFKFRVIGATLGFLQLKMYAFSGDWKLQAQIDYSYDANDFLVLIDEKMDFGAGLMPFGKSTYTNNSVGLPLTEINEQLNFTTFTMENFQKITYSYNASNTKELISEVESYWGTNQWSDTSKTNYTRNAKLLSTTEIYQVFTAPATLLNQSRYDFTYDVSDSFVMESLSKYWDTNTNNWIESYKTIYTYSATNKALSTLYQQMNQNAWKDNNRSTYFYNVDDNITKELYESYSGTVWVNQGQSLYSYNPTDIEDESVDLNNFKLYDNYPNPFNPSTIINYELPIGSFVTLKIYDVLGNEIATLVNEYRSAGKYQTSFNAKNISNQQLSSGTYFYQLQTDGKIITKKMILLR